MARNLAIIPARGGSKGVPRKNLRLLAGKPLIQHAIDCALESECFDLVVVSSEDEEILRVSESLGAVAHVRNSSLALDETPMDPVIAEVLSAWGAQSGDSFCLLQPTSPLRTSGRVREAYTVFRSRGSADAVFSVVAAQNTVQKAVYLDKEGILRGVFSPQAPFMRRQDFPPSFFHNGAIYLCDSAAYLATGALSALRATALRMDSAESLDIDNLSDFDEAERFLRRGRL